QNWVSEFKRVWLGQKHPDLIPGPKALADEDKTVEWESGLRAMYVDYPTEWALANFTSPADRRDCTVQFLILQTKKVRQDEAEATKKAAEAARTLTKRPPAPLHRPAPLTSSTHVTPMTPTTASATTSSLLSTRSALITGKRARNDDEGEVAGSPPAKRPRQVELPQLRFTSFSISFRGPNSFRIHYTTC